MICHRCKGKGYVWVMYMVTKDDSDADRELCEYCDGTGELEELGNGGEPIRNINPEPPDEPPVTLNGKL